MVLEGVAVEEAPDKYIERSIASYKNDPEYMATSWALGIAEEVVRCLSQGGKNQSWLADQMGVERAHVSKLLRAPTNMQLLTIAKLSVALGVSATVRLNPERVRSSYIEDKELDRRPTTANTWSMSEKGFANATV